MTTMAGRRPPPPPPPPRRVEGESSAHTLNGKANGFSDGGEFSAAPSVASTADGDSAAPSPGTGKPPSPVSTPIDAPPTSDGRSAKQPDSLSAAAELISTLDRAFVEMNESAADASREAEDARRSARNAAEVARRYKHRNYRPSSGAAGGGRPRLLAQQGGGPSAATAIRLAGLTQPAPYDYARPYDRISPRNASDGERGGKAAEAGGVESSGKFFGGSGPHPGQPGRVPQSFPPRAESLSEPVLLDDEDYQPKKALPNGRSPSRSTPNKKAPSSFSASPSMLPPASAKKRKNVLGTPLPSTGGQAGESPSYASKMSPATRDLLARSHAEDVLSLSLELERSRQSLDAERKSHAATRSELTESKAKTVRLEGDVQRLLGDLEAERERGGREVDAARAELDRARTRVSAAEEDAQLALDLAKGSAESREQVEAWLQRALDEIEALRNRLSIAEEGGGVQAIGGRGPDGAAALPAISEEEGSNSATLTAAATSNAGASAAPNSPAAAVVPGAHGHHSHPPPPPPPRHGGPPSPAHGHAAAAVMQQTTTTTTTTQTVTTHHAAAAGGAMGSPPPPPPKPHAPKSMISAGRDVLRRAAGAASDGGDGGEEEGAARSTALAVPNQYDGLYWRDLVQSSARKRDRLRGKLAEDGDGSAAAVSGAAGTLVPRRLGGAMAAAIGNVKDGRDPDKYAIDEGLVKRVSNLLKESGRKLKLGKNWWVPATSPKKKAKGADNQEEIKRGAKPGLEGIVQSYCRSVEDRFSRVGEDLKEMRAFCEYLESKVLASSSTSTVTP